MEYEIYENLPKSLDSDESLVAIVMNVAFLQSYVYVEVADKKGHWYIKEKWQKYTKVYMFMPVS